MDNIRFKYNSQFDCIELTVSYKVTGHISKLSGVHNERPKKGSSDRLPMTLIIIVRKFVHKFLQVYC